MFKYRLFIIEIPEFILHPLNKRRCISFRFHLISKKLILIDISIRARFCIFLGHYSPVVTAIAISNNNQVVVSSLGQALSWSLFTFSGSKFQEWNVNNVDIYPTIHDQVLCRCSSGKSFPSNSFCIYIWNNFILVLDIELASFIWKLYGCRIIRIRYYMAVYGPTTLKEFNSI